VRSELYDFRKPRINLEDIVLSDLNQHIVHEIKSNHSNKELFNNHNLDIKTRILLYWPPWTWKTLFAYALAWELWLKVMHVWLDQLISSYLWETWKNIRKIFEDASKEDCIIFLDEFDAVAKHRDDATELWELKRVVTVLLQYIDHLNTNNILISATNHYHLLDSAIIRRFEYKINLWILDKTALIKLYSVYLKNHLIDSKDFKKLAEISEGMSWAVIRQIIDKALKKWILETQQDQTKIVDYLVVEILLYQLKFLSEDQKNNKTKIIDAIKEVHKITNTKYTYKDFETITGIPDSTLNGRVKK
jgi:SpoVK/Ycf46/Vps4 family AAA+-type ATPase